MYFSPNGLSMNGIFGENVPNVFNYAIVSETPVRLLGNRKKLFKAKNKQGYIKPAEIM